MFTGIVEELGQIKSITWNGKGARLKIESPLVLNDAKVGDSLAVNGCCLTIVECSSTTWCCDVVNETMERTCFKKLQMGDRVNLERSLKLQDRLSGHLMQGHVDDVGEILSKESLTDNSWWVVVHAPASILRYIVYKGSIAVDGVSLTVANLTDQSFAFAMIPHTAHMTTLGFKSPGSSVNLEVDLIAKYIERLASPCIQPPIR